MQRYKRETGERFPKNENCRASDLLDILWGAQDVMISRLPRHQVNPHLSLFKDEQAYLRICRFHEKRYNAICRFAGY